MTWAAAILTATLAAVANAQPASVHFAWTWSEVLANTATPSTATPGVIDPTEGVRLTLHAEMVPGIGSPVTIQFPPSAGTGTIYAFVGNATELLGSSGALGRFSLLSVVPGFVTDPIGSVLGTNLIVHATNNVVLGQPVNLSNPIDGLLSLTWTPESYEARTVSFTSRDALVAGDANGVYARYGTSPSGSPLLGSARALGVHGIGTGAIPIVPAPAGLILFAAAAFAGRRKRTKQHTRHSNRCST